MRVFLAISPPDEARLALIDQIRDFELPGRLVPPDNWHMTLRFLGEVDETTVDRYAAAIDQADLGRSFIVGLGPLGAFPRPSKATVVWAGVDRGELRLHQLAEVADDGALDAAIAGEDRPFRPHLTLSRVRPPANVSGLVDDAEVDVAWRVQEAILFRTVPGRGAVEYEALESFSLTG